MNRQDQLSVTWHGHSCFVIDNGNKRLVIDPYNPKMIGYPPLKIAADLMLASHEHGDHNERSVVEFSTKTADAPVFLQADEPWADQPEDKAYQVKRIATYHDQTKGSQRGANTVHIIRANGLTIAHLGDLGHLLSAEQISQAGALDLLLLPVGGYYTIDAAKAKQTVLNLKPRNVAPMHYQIGYGDLPITTVEPFLELISDSYKPRQLPGSELVLTADLKENCFVFSFEPTVNG